MWNLSLLSRGYGEPVNKDHERLDVYFEAQDYFNWRSWSNTDSISLELNNSKYFQHDYNSIVSKTFSTRRGALVIYSENLALQAWQRQHGVKWRRATKLRLSTLSDLTRAVLAYGQREDGSSPNHAEPYLHFLVGHKNHPGNRKIHPGYSAKRYLTCLTESCDPSLLHRLQGSGCIRDLSLLRGISFNPFLFHQTKCDLSEVPRPYLVLPCLPFSLRYQNWSGLDEEENENGEEGGLDAGESCPISHVEGALQPDSSRSEKIERRLKRENEAEGVALHHSDVYLLIALPPSGEELDKEETEQPQNSYLIKRLDAEGKDHGRCSMLGQPVIDSSQLFSQKSNVTYYGGSMTGLRRGLCGKSRPSNQCGSRQPLEPVDSKIGRLQLPPISSETEAEVWPIEEDKDGEPELLKLPVVRRRPLAAARWAGREGGRVKPEEVQIGQKLVLPPLTDGEQQNQNAENVYDEVTEHEGKLEYPISIEPSKMEGMDDMDQLSVKYPISTERRSGPNGEETGFLPQISIQSETEERTDGFVEKRLEEDAILLEEGVIQNEKGRPVLQLLPPIQGIKGPGKQRSMACIKRKARKTKTSAPGIVRGTVPEKLRVHKDISGSLIMAPDGEIVRLSMLDYIQAPSGSFPGCSSHPGSKSLHYAFGGKKDKSITTRRRKGGFQPDSSTISSFQEEDIYSTSDDDDLICEIDGDSSRSQTPTQLSMEQRRARKALRRRRRRQAYLDGATSGPVSESAEGAKVNSDRRAKEGAKVNTNRGAKVNTNRGAKVNTNRRAKGEANSNSNSNRRATEEAKVSRRQRQAPGDVEEVILGEDGNLHQFHQPGRARHSSDYNSVHERELAHDTRQTTRGSTYRTSAAGSILTGWSQKEHNSLGETDELGSPLGFHEVESGHHPNARRRRKKLRKDGLVVEEDPEADAEDWEAERWSEGSEGRTGVKAKKQKSKRKGRKSSNQDPNIQDGYAELSSEDEWRESSGSILAPGENSPFEQESSLKSQRRQGANYPSDTGSSLRPGQARGANKEKSKNNGRAEFVVGRPREKRAQQQYLPPGKHQKDATSQLQRKAKRGSEVKEEGEEEEDDITTQIGMRSDGVLHFHSGNSTPTSEMATTAEQGPNSSSTQVRARGPRVGGAWSKGQAEGQAEESTEWSERATAVPGSKHPRQLGNKRLEMGQRSDEESQNYNEQLDPSERRRRRLEQQIQQELDEEQRRRVEKIRVKKLQQESEATEQEKDEQRQQGEQLDRERRQKQQQEFRKKVQEMQQVKERVLAERAKEKAQLQKFHQEQLEEEQRLLSEMDEPQRQEYLRLKQIREQQLKEQWQKEGERRKVLLEEATREAMSFLRQKGLIGPGLVLVELMELEQAQSITRPWVFSYFEVMEILGLEAAGESE
ncbi:uncharacterized protein KIAA2012 homolog isoform X2 [Amblyraja radiata]|uniref:uncharacterized protein KIAA2012 homolog isoform X2 n=1 Tax=Amblyraja radiata TaxID=386614 RepID=UPI00140230DE|nr:uncharacterized protein KIAA2012 homolog isoform X2 [Amblyraja radiata]